MSRVGDKFIIEVGSEYGNSGSSGPNKLYRIKGFNSLVFDEEGFRRLKKYESPEKEEIDAGDCQVAIGRLLGLTNREREVIFGSEQLSECLWWAALHMKDFVRKLKEYDRVVVVGDEVESEVGTFVITEIRSTNKGRKYILGYDVNDGFKECGCLANDAIKTGKKFTEAEVDTIKKAAKLKEWR